MLNNTFTYRNNILYAEDVPVPAIAQRWGTPCYIYSRAYIEEQYRAFDQALGNYPHKICYAVKANSNLAVLNILQQLNSGFDIVSGGELARVLAAGGDPQHVIFSGVGKQCDEITSALAADIYCFNVESSAELIRLNEIAAQQNKHARIALRINPDIDAGTHPYISTGLKENKFGIAMDEAIALYQEAAKLPHLKIVGIGCHIGSQLLEIEPYLAALDRLLKLTDELQQIGITIEHLDIGGGLGVCYRNENPPSAAEFCQAILAKLKQRKLLLILEPGRSITANGGILLTKVEYLKHTSSKNFAIVDAAMNDLIRPALYNAWHNIIPVEKSKQQTHKLYDVVGPICETGDFLGKDRELAVQTGDLLAICTTGAYGFINSSNYNARPRIAEIMVDKDQAYLIREREQISDLFKIERLLNNADSLY